MSWLQSLGPELVAGGVFSTLLLLGLLGREALGRRRGAEEPLRITRRARPPEEAPSGVVQALAAPRDPGERSALRRGLAQAGFEGGLALEEYVALRTVLALALPLGVSLLWRPDEVLALGSMVLLLTAAGYYAPALVVWRRRVARHESLARSFPNALDMLVSCVEVGLAIDAALLHVARELRPAAPLLSVHLDEVNAELRAGVTRLDALQHFADRTGLEEAQSLVNVLAQAERYGAGIAQSLRAHAQLLRRHRALDAEKRAAQATPKLTVAMILFILPPLFVVLMGPSIVNISQRLMPILSGGAQ